MVLRPVERCREEHSLTGVGMRSHRRGNRRDGGWQPEQRPGHSECPVVGVHICGERADRVGLVEVVDLLSRDASNQQSGARPPGQTRACGGVALQHLRRRVVGEDGDRAPGGRGTVHERDQCRVLRPVQLDQVSIGQQHPKPSVAAQPDPDLGAG